MTKPSVFVSSTFVDLKHVRAQVAEFIDNIGYQARLFEKGGIGFDYQKPLDESCYEAVEECEIFVLIIGGRYGAPATSEAKGNVRRYNSITRKEYLTARRKNIPIYIFVEGDVLAEFKTYQKNKNNKSIQYAFVDNPLIFELIDDIYKQNLNNYIHPFSSIEDITKVLKNQWASMLKTYINNRSKNIRRNTVRVNSLKLFFYRRLNKKSQKMLASEVGVTGRKISQLEKLNRVYPSFDGYHEKYFPQCEFSLVAKLENALNCPGKLRAGNYDDFLSMYVEYYVNNKETKTLNFKQSHPLLNFETRAVVFDFDGTISKSDGGKTTWELLWEHLGYSINECADYHTKFRKSEITHAEWCQITLEKFKAGGMNRNSLSEVAQKLGLVDGFEELITELRERNIRLFIVSGSIRDLIREAIGDSLFGQFEAVKANEMDFDSDGNLTEIVGTKFDFQGKADFIRDIVEEKGYSPMDVLFVGNAGNDRWAGNSGARTLCVNPGSTDPDNPKEWNNNIRMMSNMKEILDFV